MYKLYKMFSKQWPMRDVRLAIVKNYGNKNEPFKKYNYYDFLKRE